METFQTALNLLQKGDCLVSADLKYAFQFVINIENKDVFEKKIASCEFQCLPFGLKSAPRKFKNNHEASYVSPKVSSGNHLNRRFSTII